METKIKKESVIKFLFKIAVLAAVYFVSAKIGLSLAVATEQVTTVWPPTGIALAVLVLFGMRFWPGVFIGAFVANLLTNEPPLVAFGIAIGNTLEAVIAVYLLKQFNFNASLTRLSDVLKLILIAAFFSTALAATIGVGSLIMGGIVNVSNFLPVWLTWWLGDMMGDLLMAPLLLVWMNRKNPPTLNRRSAEFSLLFIILIIVCSAVFAQNLGNIGGLASSAYIVFPFIFWAAWRFEQTGIVAAVFTIASIAVIGTTQGFGPFTTESHLEQNLIFLQTFLFIVTTASLFFAAAISERRHAQTQLSKKEQEWKALIEHSHDIIVLLDMKAKIIYASPSTKKIAGYEPEDLIGVNGFSLVHPDDLKKGKKLMTKLILKPGSTQKEQLRFKHKDGSWRWFEKTATNLLLEPAVEAIVVNLRDITVEKEVDLAKTEFVSLASHQLRNPLTVLKWYLGPLISDWEIMDMDTRRNYLKQLYSANQRMIELVNSMLNVSRLDLGKFGFNPVSVNVREAIESVIKQLDVIIQEKHMQLKMIIGRDIPKINADETLLQMILQNLISNAIKYTPKEGKITINVKKAGKKIEVMIRDSGIGIPKEEQKKVFEKFHRTERARSLDPEGNGLGLYIVANAVKEMKGSLKLESEVDKGTAFYVILPI